MNKHLRPITLFAILSTLLHSAFALACTTGVISGKATVDGRPLLWKNRDAPHKNNQLVQITGGKYVCTAVVNAGQRSSIWMGVNEAGFCIENSVTKDLSEAGAKGMGNGSFMLKALQTCATVSDFEELLSQSNGNRATNANFGVIDAQGGAAIFESSASSFKMFDANDPVVAPNGYVVRSNFSYTGSTSVDPEDPIQVRGIYSGGRFLRGCQLLDMGIADGGVSVAYLLQHCTRDFADASGQAISGSINGPMGDLPAHVDTSHTISRRTSVSAAVFHGVKPGEDPLLTTMWTMLGEPAFTIAIPCWVGAEFVAEEAAGNKTSPLCNAARALRDAAYVTAESVSESQEAEVLETGYLPSIWAATLPKERANLDLVSEALGKWRTTQFDREEAKLIHQKISTDALEQLLTLSESFVAVGVSVNE